MINKDIVEYLSSNDEDLVAIGIELLKGEHYFVIIDTLEASGIRNLMANVWKKVYRREQRTTGTFKVYHLNYNHYYIVNENGIFRSTENYW